MTEENDGLVKPFLEHLEDLRRTILWCVAALTVGVGAAIPLAPHILALLKRPLSLVNRDPEHFLRVLEVTGGLAIAMRIILWSGILLSAPFMVMFIGQFVFPGLHRHERRAVVGATLAGVALFAGGVIMGYTMALPAALRIMFTINDWMHVHAEYVLVTDYVSFTLKILVAFGLTFELPIVVLALGWIGLVDSAKLRAWRSYVVVGIFILAAILTPPDPFTQLIMAIPMTALYEMCVWILWFREKSRRAAQA
jgi:sec-independent protein translocase protein TatC